MDPGSKYRLGERIGGGGMAEVFEATLVGAEGFSRPVAIKRMLPALSSDPAFGDMFVNEARLASLLHHSSIASVLDFDRDDEGRYYLVMELIRGVDLRTLADTGRLPVPICLHIAAELLRGLDYAHELVHDGRHLRLVHRDVSPHNVMVSFAGGVKLVDFGIAKAVAATGASRTGSLKGKVAYMSPEQAHGHQVDGRADVFAVGVILHELLTGQRLFGGATEPEILARLLTQPIPVPSERARDVPPDVDRAVMAMLARDPAQRVENAHSALEQLLHCQASSSRAGLELRGLLVERFPNRVPERGTGTTGKNLALGTPPTARHALTDESASLSIARANPTVASAKAARKSQAGWLIAATMISTAAIVAALVIRTGRSGNTDAKSASEVDASVIAAVALDASGPISMSVVDAGLPTRSIDASAVRPTTRLSKKEERARRKAEAKAEKERLAKLDREKRESAQAAREKAAKEKAAKAARDKEKEIAARDAKKDPKASGMGRVFVQAKPWAEIFVRGRSYGITPQEIPLPLGSNTIVFKNKELNATTSRKVNVVSHKRASVSATMK